MVWLRIKTMASGDILSSSCADFGSENARLQLELAVLPRITGKRPGFCVKDFLINKSVVIQNIFRVPILFTILTYILTMSLYQLRLIQGELSLTSYVIHSSCDTQTKT